MPRYADGVEIAFMKKRVEGGGLCQEGIDISVQLNLKLEKNPFSKDPWYLEISG